jgi:peptidoglycan-associated lipoprotein
MRPNIASSLVIVAVALNLVGCTENTKPAAGAENTTTAKKPAPIAAPKPDLAAIPMVAAPEAFIEADPIQEGGIQVSGELAEMCNLHATGAKQHFGTNDDTLLPAERDMLVQLATCLSEGALRSRGLELIGRADPRGEQEYNMVLGEKRAARVAGYLESAGVGRTRMKLTSRGELDAAGKDEGGWQEDRRVDIALAPAATAGAPATKN